MSAAFAVVSAWMISLSPISVDASITSASDVHARGVFSYSVAGYYNLQKTSCRVVTQSTNISW